MTEPQPTAEQETANAAFVWRRQVQADVIAVLREDRVSLERIEWWLTAKCID